MPPFASSAAFLSRPLPDVALLAAPSLTQDPVGPISPRALHLVHDPFLSLSLLSSNSPFSNLAHIWVLGRQQSS